MNITSEIESMILEMSRSGAQPRYIIIGINQYLRWGMELREKRLPERPETYMGYEIIICKSDIIEVVTSPGAQYRAFLKK